MNIVLEHIRSFAQKRSISLKPLTLLVGENSSGKSTFLSVVSAVMDASRFPANPAFNDPPYNLGTFENIATFRGGKYGRDDTFSIGFSVENGNERSKHEVLATYISSYGNAVLQRVTVKGSLGRIDVTLSSNNMSGFIEVQTESNSNERTEFSVPRPDTIMAGHRAFAVQLIEAIAQLAPRTNNKKPFLIRQMFDVVEQMEPPYPTSFSFAPIRSKPRRTYDELREEFNPECDHIPSLLARLLRQEPDSADSQSVRSALADFGRESGLFRMINVKKLGSKMTDPFQIQVAGAGPAVNITDVGYGVSQSLPIVVQSVLRSTSKILLMQQPEVHLHPRAQAALGTFLSRLVGKNDRIVVVETHSDYLLDRVRQEVAAGTIPAENVRILFFHKPKLETKVYEVNLDSTGNVLEAPASYREFFLKEELNLFSRTGGDQ